MVFFSVKEMFVVLTQLSWIVHTIRLSVCLLNFYVEISLAFVVLQTLLVPLLMFDSHKVNM